MSQWDGKSKGTLLGYKIFVFLIKKAGVRAAYALLIFVALYYFLFNPKSFRAVYYYLRQRQGYGFWTAFCAVYRLYFVFGQTIIDKVAISAGLRDRFTYEFDGIETLKDALDAQRGGILISAHVGNFEIADKFFADIDLNFQINLVTVDQERTLIKEYLERINAESSVKFIHIKEDMSHVFEIGDALSNNELICFTGDRYFEGMKTLECSFLGKETSFPAGPFHIASRLGVPVIFVYVMKEKNLHYHLYARRAEQVKRRDPQSYLEAYRTSVEQMLARYPLQWFNFFDFWSSNKNN
ncbi:LpxL/LpxP family acyltransferase [Sphingobacterium paludis]|uniref:Putative LPLAT superfamily acyltransferase n=1 Tax=Sphingobacterium paludis TaxID=1476465 RepID=A0A4R7D6G1_9SPHI|nr:lipid A biosynthesis acyltransferase [Sphingobacterium paludis]TDS14546.1 putative LPLAT superfamily acyltransferase [Sphingobacterium paludis]